MDIFPAVWAGCCVVVGFSSVVVLFIALLEVLKPPTNVFLTIAFLLMSAQLQLVFQVWNDCRVRLRHCASADLGGSSGCLCLTLVEEDALLHEAPLVVIIGLVEVLVYVVLPPPYRVLV